MDNAATKQPTTVLSEDDFTCLMIAARGESLIAIARWEKPIERLVKLGFLHQHDRANNVITPDGRAAVEKHEQALEKDTDAALGKFIEDSSRRAVAQRSAAEEANQAVERLVLAAKIAASATGDSLDFACRQYSKMILDAALDKLKQ